MPITDYLEVLFIIALGPHRHSLCDFQGLSSDIMCGSLRATIDVPVLKTACALGNSHLYQD